jgi:hypothetical protein
MYAALHVKYLHFIFVYPRCTSEKLDGPVRSISFRGIESYVVHNSDFWGTTQCCFTNQHGVKPDNLFNNEANTSNHTSVKLTPHATLSKAVSAKYTLDLRHSPVWVWTFALKFFTLIFILLPNLDVSGTKIPQYSLFCAL